jgi:AraC-like DNA-binding protein
VTTVYDVSDMDTAGDVMSSQYTAMRLSAHGQRQGLRIAQDRLGPIRLDHTTFRMDFDAEGDPLDGVYVGHVLAGEVSYRNGRDVACYLPGDVFFPCLPGQPLRARVHEVDCVFALIPPYLLAKVAHTEPGDQRPVQLTGCDPVSPEAAQMWLRTFNYAHRIAASGRDPQSCELMLGSVARLLAAATLETFPHTALLDPTIEDRHDAHPQTLRRAIAFIEANPHHDISTADIAAAAHVTIRAIQLAFKRHLDTTPMAYLRRVRLHQAHLDLLQATPETNSVTAIAARWGFPSPNHFATLYRREFGEPPSRTLQR